MNEQNEQQTTRRRRPPLSETEREQIIELHHMGYGSRRITRRGPWSRKQVRQVLDQAGLSSSRHRPPASKLDPYRPLIEQKVHKGLTTTRILREIREAGYSGGRTILAEAVRQMRRSLAMPEHRTVKRRFETGPAVEMQIDWSPYRILIAEVLVTVYALGCLLCHSRKLFVYFFDNERQPTLLEGLAMAFEYFRGCAHRLVLDNMSTAVVGRYQPDGQVLWTERFADFVRHYGVTPFACKPKDADRKGKKEKSFRLVWDDLLKGSSFESFEDLNARGRQWLDHTPEVGNHRIHGTTGRVPNEVWTEEQPLLIALPGKRFAVYEHSVRVVDNDSTLSVRGRRYTVPSTLANHSVAVHLFAEHFEVLDPHGRTAFSRRYVPDSDPRRLIIDRTHYATVRRRAGLGSERLDAAFVARFPTLAPLVRGLQLRMKSLAGVHLRALLRLVDRYGSESFVAAAEYAQNYRRFDARAVERILEQRHGPGEDPPIRPLTGRGPDLVPDVEPGDLDSYADLDTRPEAKNPNAANDDVSERGNRGEHGPTDDDSPDDDTEEQ